MKHIHIVVLDDSFVIREGIQSIFSKFQFVQRVSLVNSVDELGRIMRRTACHFVILNPQFLLSSHPQLQQLKNQHDCVKWVGILYSHHAASTLARLDGTIDIYDTQETIASKMLKWIEIGSDESSLQNKDTLTDREIDVLKLLADGKSNKEIADNLNISINTVITHRKNITQKTGIKSVSGLTIYAVVQNLISLDNY